MRTDFEETLAGSQPATLAVGTPKLTPPVGLDQNDWRVYAIRWQPAPGVWATVEVANSSAAQAPRLAALVRFDRATRCAQPLAVDRPPTGSHLISCVIELSSDRIPYAGSGLIYGDGQHVLQLGVMLDSAVPRKVGLPAGPYRVDPDPDGVTYSGAVGPLWVDESVQGKRHYTRQQVLDTFASLRPVGKVNDPSTYR